MNPINKLAELFAEFPGIGPRQAKRFVYFLLTMPPSFTKDLIRAVENLKSTTVTCSSCFRIFSSSNMSITSAHAAGGTNANGVPVLCSICSNPNRDSSMLAIVSRDSDLESIEKSGSYNGLYFVLGGIVPILETNPEKKIRQAELLAVVKQRSDTRGLSEIILALSANADSENTAQYIFHILSGYKDAGLKISLLGRGLSTGTELEYSDADTLRNALKNRK